MRESKFRAWDTRKKKMYSAEEMGQDQLTICPDGRGFINVHGSSTKLSTFLSHLIPLEYTGLHDSKGREIFEGDIVHKSDKLGTWSIEYDNNTASFIAFNQLNSNRSLEASTCSEEIYKLKKGEIVPTVLICDNKYFLCEIIGNIYENPALVKP